jgi:tetratricopeptide (TPR) repeat protein
MQNISQKIIGAEHLTEVIAYLKNADKYIRQGEINQALDEIMRAREKNPTIMYARAYEEYVRSVLLKQTDLSDNGIGTASKESIIEQLLPTLEKILDLAIKEVKRSAVTAYKQKEVYALQRQQEEEQRTEEQLRSSGLAKKIAVYLKRARELEAHNDYHNALNEVARAFMLDPTDERILQIEEEIKISQDEYNNREEKERAVRQKEEEQRRETLFELWRRERDQEKNQELKKREEAYKQARTQKIREYLQIARSLFADKKLEEAVSQLAFVMVLDPLNEEVLDLNWKIREAQTKQNEEHIEKRKQQIEEDKKREESIKAAVAKSLLKAKEYLEQQRFGESLRVITQAYFIDPSNEDVIALEKQIMIEEEETLRREEEERKRSEDERLRKQEAELHRLAIEQQKREQIRERVETEAKLLRDEEEVLLFLSKARGYVSQGSYDEALNHIAKAFKINPFDAEIAKLQREILDGQKKAKQQKRSSIIEPDSLGDEATNAIIGQHLQNAKRLRASMKYKEALDEIAQAYRLDPMNEDLFALEGEIQQDFLRHEEEQQKLEESSKMSQGIKKSLAMAREALSRESYAEALGWVDYAMSFDMQRYETLQMRDEIERAQRRLEEQKANEDKELVIQFHLSKAMECISENRMFEAIFEVDLALRLNPNHTGALSMRKKLSETRGESVSA